MEKNKPVDVELADHFKIVLHNKNMHCGWHYHEDEWDITVYAPTIEDLISQATKRMVSQLIDVWTWELTQCQVLIYDNNVYEVKDSAKDITAEHSTLVDDLISTDSYKEAYEKEKEARAERKRQFQEKRRREYKERKAKEQNKENK